MSETKERLIKLMSEQLDLEESKITEDANLRHDLNADSLDMSELAMSVEDEFNIQVEDSDMENLETVRDIIELLEDKVKE